MGSVGGRCAVYAHLAPVLVALEDPYRFVISRSTKSRRDQSNISTQSQRRAHGPETFEH